MSERVYSIRNGKVVEGRHYDALVLYHVHESSACEGHGCWIHHPSLHHMRQWPLYWSRPVVERMCRCGTGHPDPDDLGFIARVYGEKEAETWSLHGCCGCCRAPTWAERFKTEVGWRTGYA